MTEKEVLNKIYKGDIVTFEMLYSQYYVALCVYARHFTRDKEIAEEVTQDVFLKLWEQRNKISINDTLKGYLFASVRNHCLDYLKHLQVTHKYSDYYNHLLKEAEYLYLISQETGETFMIASEMERKISEAIDALPEQCRRIFTMSRFEGMKYQEIANKLGVTMNTVQKQMSIALEKLRAKLGM